MSLAILVTSVLLAAWMGFRLIDAAYMADDLQSGLRAREGDLKTVLAIERLGVRGVSRSRAEQAVRASFDTDSDIVKWEGDTLWVNEVGLSYRGDSLIDLVLMNPVR